MEKNNNLSTFNKFWHKNKYNLGTKIMYKKHGSGFHCCV